MHFRDLKTAIDTVQKNRKTSRPIYLWGFTQTCYKREGYKYLDRTVYSKTIDLRLAHGLPATDPLVSPDFPGLSVAASSHPHLNQDRAGYYMGTGYEVSVLCDGVSKTTNHAGVTVNGIEAAQVIRDGIIDFFKHSPGIQQQLEAIRRNIDTPGTHIQKFKGYINPCIRMICADIKTHSSSTLEISLQIHCDNSPSILVAISYGDSATLVCRESGSVENLNSLFQLGIMKSVSNPGFALSNKILRPFETKIAFTRLYPNDLVVTVSDGVLDAICHAEFRISDTLTRRRLELFTAFDSTLFSKIIQYGRNTDLNHRQMATLIAAVASVVTEKPDDISIVIQTCSTKPTMMTHMTPQPSATALLSRTVVQQGYRISPRGPSAPDLTEPPTLTPSTQGSEIK